MTLPSPRRPHPPEPHLTVVFDEPHLTVVFDDACALCRRCHLWLADQDAVVPLRFLAASDPVAIDWLGDRVPIGQELVVVDHCGAVWVGPDAFIAVLAVLRRYRSLSRRLQRPALRPLARQAFHAVSLSRGSVSALIGAPAVDDSTLVAQLARLEADPVCDGDACAVPRASVGG